MKNHKSAGTFSTITNFLLKSNKKLKKEIDARVAQATGEFQGQVDQNDEQPKPTSKLKKQLRFWGFVTIGALVCMTGVGSIFMLLYLAGMICRFLARHWALSLLATAAGCGYMSYCSEKNYPTKSLGEFLNPE